ncbi:MAG: site-2 protease family protein [Planctomycetaceae bacterium]|nr:site-2 protease family protein [Planctomycetaceae bacterium]
MKSIKSAIRLGHLAGIPLFLHWSFLLVPAYVLISGYLMGRPAFGVAADMTLVTVIFGCVVLHELGHALAARRYGIATRDIILMPIGGVARLERIPRKPAQELVVALAGPAVNLVIATALLAIAVPVIGMDGLWTPQSLTANLVGKTIAINVVMIVFNMLPAFPMDGGRVLRALLAMRLPYVRATRIAAVLGQMTALLIGVVGAVVFNNFMLMFIALFVWAGARQELAQVEMEASLQQLTVRDALITGFDAVPAQARVDWTLQFAMSANRTEIPVVNSGHFLGIARTEALATAIRNDFPEAPAGEFAEPAPVHLQLHEPLNNVVLAFQQTTFKMLPVVDDDGLLLGFVTLESILAAGQFRSLVRPASPVVVRQRPDELRDHLTRMQPG